MPKLFLVYLGGTVPKGNIEVHDVRFVAGDTLEQTYPLLIEQWFGNKKGLHIDSYMEVRLIDGHRIELKREKFLGEQNLYFINFGGYDKSTIAELHQFGLFVGNSIQEVKQLAKQKLLVDSVSQHKDDLFDIDDCFVIEQIQNYYIHLTPDESKQEFKPDWFGYKVIG